MNVISIVFVVLWSQIFIVSTLPMFPIQIENQMLNLFMMSPDNLIRYLQNIAVVATNGTCIDRSTNIMANVSTPIINELDCNIYQSSNGCYTVGRYFVGPNIKQDNQCLASYIYVNRCPIDSWNSFIYYNINITITSSESTRIKLGLWPNELEFFFVIDKGSNNITYSNVEHGDAPVVYKKSSYTLSIKSESNITITVKSWAMMAIYTCY